MQGRRSLKWDSYVGVLETPCGTRLEIVPKHHEEGDCLQKGRQLLRKLIQRALDLKAREASVAGLELFEAPLSEWVMAQFLAELDLLVKRGVRFDYQRVEEEQRFLRGQLNVVAQMRQRPGKQHYFQIRHDVFQPNRAENRLLKSALEQVAKSTRDANNWRLAAELRAMLSDLPASRQIDLDFRAWSTDRLMAHYQAIKPWCELILNQQMPLAVSGEWRGMSMLFPMEKLFERYVEGWLRNCLVPGAELITQGKGGGDQENGPEVAPPEIENFAKTLADHVGCKVEAGKFSGKGAISPQQARSSQRKQANRRCGLAGGEACNGVGRR